LPRNKPNPGSEKALELGCTCPVIDNHYGKGVPFNDGPQFWINGDCPIHGTTTTITCKDCGWRVEILGIEPLTSQCTACHSFNLKYQ
jgi:hypothetical protein